MNLNEEFVQHLSVALSKLLLPDNSEIEQATKKLRELNHHSQFAPSLLFLISTNASSQVRQLAAVVLRRKLQKCWKLLDYNDKLSLRQSVLKQLTVESDDNVRRAVMQLVGSVSKFELATEHSWPELMEFVECCIRSDNNKQCEVGMHLLSIVCSHSVEHMTPQYSALLTLIGEVLDGKSVADLDTANYAVQAFNSLVPFLGDDQANLVRPLVPKSVEVVRKLLVVDEHKAAQLIELFESLIETEVAFIVPFIKDLVFFSLEMAQNANLEEDTRVRALSLLQWIIKVKKKAILKHKLISAILDTLGPIIVSPLDDSDDDDEDELGMTNDSENRTAVAACLQVIDDLALHLPAEKLFEKIMPFVQSCTNSSEDRHRRGLLLTLACLSEGTSEHIKANYLNSFVEIVCRGATDPNTRVRNAALFALGQFSEHLQPDISTYAPQIMPLLFSLLQQLSATPTGAGITRAYYALENFVENLNEKILPYLDPLMKHLLSTLRSPNHLHSKELAVSAIGAVENETLVCLCGSLHIRHLRKFRLHTANSASEHLQPYLDELLQLIEQCLSNINGHQEKGAEDLTVLHTQALDTLGVIMRTAGKSNMQLAEDCLKLAMSLVANNNPDPDRKRAAFGLFSALACIVKDGMAPFLKVIVESMITSAQSTEGVIAHFADEEDSLGSANLSFLDDSAETDLENGAEDDDDSDLVEAFSVENSYMDEKADACESLGDLAKHCPQSFAPFLGECFEEVFKQIEFPHSDVRKSAIASCGQFTMAAYQQQNPSYSHFLLQLFPTLCNVISEDTERLVVMTTLMTTKELVEACGTNSFVNQEQDVQMLMTSLVQVLQQKAACQDEEGEEDEQQAEYDEMLIEYCGEVFPSLAGALKNSFQPYFQSCLPALLSRLKASCTSAERSFATGTIAETVEKLGADSTSNLLPHLVPRFVQLSRDPDSEVRNNTIYGLGVILQNGGSASIDHYPAVLGCLSQALAKEKNRRVIDNILSAVCRMIIMNRAAIPLGQVLPVLLQKLPIIEDHDEDAIVYACLARLLHDDEVAGDVTTVGRIVEIFTAVCVNEDTEADVKSSVKEEIRQLSSRNGKTMMMVLEQMTPVARSAVERIVEP